MGEAQLIALDIAEADPEGSKNSCLWLSSPGCWRPSVREVGLFGLSASCPGVADDRDVVRVGREQLGLVWQVREDLVQAAVWYLWMMPPSTSCRMTSPLVVGFTGWGIGWASLSPPVVVAVAPSSEHPLPARNGSWSSGRQTTRCPSAAFMKEDLRGVSWSAFVLEPCGCREPCPSSSGRQSVLVDQPAEDVGTQDL